MALVNIIIASFIGTIAYDNPLLDRHLEASGAGRLLRFF